MFGLQCPSDPCIDAVVECAKWRLGRNRKKKDIITVEILQKCVDISDLSRLADLRIIFMCVLAFSGFLRFSELQSIRRCDIIFMDHYLKVFIQSSKTDQFRDGAWIIIVRSGEKTCPYSLAKLYCEASGLPEDAEEFLFTGLLTKKDGSQVLRSDSKPISYTHTRELFLDLFKRASYTSCNIGLRSLRAGGASRATNNGVPDRLFKRHGRQRMVM